MSFIIEFGDLKRAEDFADEARKRFSSLEVLVFTNAEEAGAHASFVRTQRVPVVHVQRGRDTAESGPKPLDDDVDDWVSVRASTYGGQYVGT